MKGMVWVGGSHPWCLVIVAIFMLLAGAKRLSGEVSKSSYGGKYTNKKGALLMREVDLSAYHD